MNDKGKNKKSSFQEGVDPKDSAGEILQPKKGDKTRSHLGSSTRSENTTATKESALNKKYWGLLFRIRLSIRYHMRRQKFFLGLNRLTSAFGVIFGSAAIASLLTTFGSKELTLVFAGIVTIFSAIDLVIGSAQSLTKHDGLRKQFIQVEKELTSIDDFNDQVHKEIFAKILAIESEEPPTIDIVNILSHNDVVLAESDYSENQTTKNLFHVAWYKRLTAGIIPWQVSHL